MSCVRQSWLLVRFRSSAREYHRIVSYRVVYRLITRTGLCIVGCDMASVLLIVCRQKRMDKYHYYIRLRMDTPEPTGFIPVAYSICKLYCGKLYRRSSRQKKKPVRQSAAAATPTPLQSRTPSTAGPRPWPRQPSPGRARMPPRPPRFPVMSPARPAASGPRLPPPRFPVPHFHRPPTMSPLPRPPAKMK